MSISAAGEPSPQHLPIRGSSSPRLDPALIPMCEGLFASHSGGNTVSRAQLIRDVTLEAELKKPKAEFFGAVILSITAIAISAGICLLWSSKPKNAENKEEREPVKAKNDQTRNDNTTNTNPSTTSSAETQSSTNSTDSGTKPASTDPVATTNHAEENQPALNENLPEHQSAETQSSTNSTDSGTEPASTDPVATTNHAEENPEAPPISANTPEPGQPTVFERLEEALEIYWPLTIKRNNGTATRDEILTLLKFDPMRLLAEVCKEIAEDPDLSQEEKLKLINEMNRAFWKRIMLTAPSELTNPNTTLSKSQTSLFQKFLRALRKNPLFKLLLKVFKLVDKFDRFLEAVDDLASKGPVKISEIYRLLDGLGSKIIRNWIISLLEKALK